MEKHTISVDIAGKTLTFETGRIARHANSAVLARCGDTMVLATVCASQDPLQEIDFLPLRVDYQEKFSSVGRTVSGFIKREGKPTERETLTCRLIDRPIRPMIREGYHHDLQLLSYVWSYDSENSPDVLAICATSAALALSDVPLIKPIAAVRIGFLDDQFLVNPTSEQQKQSKMDLVIAGTEDAILMIEGLLEFLTEEQVLQAVELGQAAIKEICKTIHQWQSLIGKEKNVATLRKTPQIVIDEVLKATKESYKKACTITDKAQRDSFVKEVEKRILELFCTAGKDVEMSKVDVKSALDKVYSDTMREMIINENKRCDARKTTEIRHITIEQTFLPRAHGSSLFTRGQTQTLAVCVLGSENMAQRFENLEGEGASRFYLHYTFPPFSVGEVGRMGAPGRREIGHGKLAERALLATLPSKEKFPYVIRLESNITESNGSSSMASVCGGCLALMDAGVPIERPVAGIAMGLVIENGKFVILSDIQGVEDHLGDMDFKVAGDHVGITALQMDIKVEGITFDIMKAALMQAKDGRIHILDKMLEVCPKSKEEMSEFAPRIETIKVKPSKIGIIIGPGGKQIRAIIEETGVDIDINDDGIVSLTAQSATDIKRAKDIIMGLTAEVEIGKVYEGTVTSIVPFGIFVEILPGKEGLCHISELDNFRIEDILVYTKDKIKIGDPMSVLAMEINDRGQIKLSRRKLLPR